MSSTSEMGLLSAANDAVQNLDNTVLNVLGKETQEQIIAKAITAGRTLTHGSETEISVKLKDMTEAEYDDYLTQYRHADKKNNNLSQVTENQKARYEKLYEYFKEEYENLNASVKQNYASESHYISVKIAKQIQREYAKQVAKNRKFNELEIAADTPPTAAIFEEYGNNYFELNTYDFYEQEETKVYRIRLAGIMKELPEFGFNCEWENGPGAGLADLIGKKIDMDIVNTVAYAGGKGSELTNFVNSDVMTNHIYKSSSPFEISINFRIYTGQNIGTTGLTTARTWIKNLIIATQPSAKNQLNIVDAIDNIETAIDSVSISNFKDTFDLSKVNDGKFDGKFETENNTAGSNSFDFSTQDADDTNKFGENRAREAPIVDYHLGAKLFELSIYPFIFKKPLTVYVKSWEVTPSKEWNKLHDDHYYYDFKITCVSDQVLSAPTWMNKLK